MQQQFNTHFLSRQTLPKQPALPGELVQANALHFPMIGGVSVVALPPRVPPHHKFSPQCNFPVYYQQSVSVSVNPSYRPSPGTVDPSSTRGYRLVDTTIRTRRRSVTQAGTRPLGVPVAASVPTQRCEQQQQPHHSRREGSGLEQQQQPKTLVQVGHSVGHSSQPSICLPASTLQLVRVGKKGCPIIRRSSQVMKSQTGSTPPMLSHTNCQATSSTKSSTTLPSLGIRPSSPPLRQYRHNPYRLFTEVCEGEGLQINYTKHYDKKNNNNKISQKEQREKKRDLAATTVSVHSPITAFFGPSPSAEGRPCHPLTEATPSAVPMSTTYSTPKYPMPVLCIDDRNDPPLSSTIIEENTKFEFSLVEYSSPSSCNDPPLAVICNDADAATTTASTSTLSFASSSSTSTSSSSFLESQNGDEPYPESIDPGCPCFYSLARVEHHHPRQQLYQEGQKSYHWATTSSTGGATKPNNNNNNTIGAPPAMKPSVSSTSCASKLLTPFVTEATSCSSDGLSIENKSSEDPGAHVSDATTTILSLTNSPPRAIQQQRQIHPQDLQEGQAAICWSQ